MITVLCMNMKNWKAQRRRRVPAHPSLLWHACSFFFHAHLLLRLGANAAAGELPQEGLDVQLRATTSNNTWNNYMLREDVETTSGTIELQHHAASEAPEKRRSLSLPSCQSNPCKFMKDFTYRQVNVVDRSEDMHISYTHLEEFKMCLREYSVNHQNCHRYRSRSTTIPILTAACSGSSSCSECRTRSGTSSEGTLYFGVRCSADRKRCHHAITASKQGGSCQKTAQAAEQKMDDLAFLAATDALAWRDAQPVYHLDGYRANLMGSVGGCQDSTGRDVSNSKYDGRYVRGPSTAAGACGEHPTAVSAAADTPVSQYPDALRFVRDQCDKDDRCQGFYLSNTLPTLSIARPYKLVVPTVFAHRIKSTKDDVATVLQSANDTWSFGFGTPVCSAWTQLEDLYLKEIGPFACPEPAVPDASTGGDRPRCGPAYHNRVCFHKDYPYCREAHGFCENTPTQNTFRTNGVMGLGGHYEHDASILYRRTGKWDGPSYPLHCHEALRLGLTSGSEHPAFVVNEARMTPQTGAVLTYGMCGENTDHRQGAPPFTAGVQSQCFGELPGCSDTCPTAQNGICEEETAEHVAGAPTATQAGHFTSVKPALGSLRFTCPRGTDCTDCGPRPGVWRRVFSSGLERYDKDPVNSTQGLERELRDIFQEIVGAEQLVPVPTPMPPPGVIPVDAAVGGSYPATDADQKAYQSTAPHPGYFARVRVCRNVTNSVVEGEYPGDCVETLATLNLRHHWGTGAQPFGHVRKGGLTAGFLVNGQVCDSSCLKKHPDLDHLMANFGRFSASMPPSGSTGRQGDEFMEAAMQWRLSKRLVPRNMKELGSLPDRTQARDFYQPDYLVEEEQKQIENEWIRDLQFQTVSSASSAWAGHAKPGLYTTAREGFSTTASNSLSDVQTLQIQFTDDTPFGVSLGSTTTPDASFTAPGFSQVGFNMSVPGSGDGNLWLENSTNIAVYVSCTQARPGVVSAANFAAPSTAEQQKEKCKVLVERTPRDDVLLPWYAKTNFQNSSSEIALSATSPQQPALAVPQAAFTDPGFKFLMQFDYQVSDVSGICGGGTIDMVDDAEDPPLDLVALGAIAAGGAVTPPGRNFKNHFALNATMGPGLAKGWYDYFTNDAEINWKPSMKQRWLLSPDQVNVIGASCPQSDANQEEMYFYLQITGVPDLAAVEQMQRLFWHSLWQRRVYDMAIGDVSARNVPVTRTGVFMVWRHLTAGLDESLPWQQAKADNKVDLGVRAPYPGGIPAANQNWWEMFCLGFRSSYYAGDPLNGGRTRWGRMVPLGLGASYYAPNLVQAKFREAQAGARADSKKDFAQMLVANKPGSSYSQYRVELEIRIDFGVADAKCPPLDSPDAEGGKQWFVDTLGPRLSEALYQFLLMYGSPSPQIPQGSRLVYDTLSPESKRWAPSWPLSTRLLNSLTRSHIQVTSMLAPCRRFHRRVDQIMAPQGPFRFEIGPFWRQKSAEELALALQEIVEWRDDALPDTWLAQNSWLVKESPWRHLVQTFDDYLVVGVGKTADATTAEIRANVWNRGGGSGGRAATVMYVEPTRNYTIWKWHGGYLRNHPGYRYPAVVAYATFSDIQPAVGATALIPAPDTYAVLYAAHNPTAEWQAMDTVVSATSDAGAPLDPVGKLYTLAVHIGLKLVFHPDHAVRNCDDNRVFDLGGTGQNLYLKRKVGVPLLLALKSYVDTVLRSKLTHPFLPHFNQYRVLDTKCAQALQGGSTPYSDFYVEIAGFPTAAGAEEVKAALEFAGAVDYLAPGAPSLDADSQARENKHLEYVVARALEKWTTNATVADGEPRLFVPDGKYMIVDAAGERVPKPCCFQAPVVIYQQLGDPTAFQRTLTVQPFPSAGLLQMQTYDPTGTFVLSKQADNPFGVRFRLQLLLAVAGCTDDYLGLVAGQNLGRAIALAMYNFFRRDPIYGSEQPFNPLFAGPFLTHGQYQVWPDPDMGSSYAAKCGLVGTTPAATSSTGRPVDYSLCDCKHTWDVVSLTYTVSLTNLLAQLPTTLPTYADIGTSNPSSDIGLVSGPISNPATRIELSEFQKAEYFGGDLSNERMAFAQKLFTCIDATQDGFLDATEYGMFALSPESICVPPGPKADGETLAKFHSFRIQLVGVDTYENALIIHDAIAYAFEEDLALKGGRIRMRPYLEAALYGNFYAAQEGQGAAGAAGPGLRMVDGNLVPYDPERFVALLVLVGYQFDFWQELILVGCDAACLRTEVAPVLLGALFAYLVDNYAVLVPAFDVYSPEFVPANRYQLRADPECPGAADPTAYAVYNVTFPAVVLGLQPASVPAVAQALRNSLTPANWNSPKTSRPITNKFQRALDDLLDTETQSCLMGALRSHSCAHLHQHSRRDDGNVSDHDDIFFARPRRVLDGDAQAAGQREGPNYHRSHPDHNDGAPARRDG
ncbi:unnamed protein product [Amoebophrya sp. A120]|nr:unnamed protein product [Amoebophrya sp. A120]|eukprot:GSA120T00024044001.1